MKEKFIFMDKRGVKLERWGEFSTSMYGERRTEDGVIESIFIGITLKTSKPTSLICRHYLGNRLLDHRAIGYTDTMEMMQAIKDYIDNLEK